MAGDHLACERRRRRRRRQRGCGHDTAGDGAGAERAYGLGRLRRSAWVATYKAAPSRNPGACIACEQNYKQRSGKGRCWVIYGGSAALRNPGCGEKSYKQRSGNFRGWTIDRFGWRHSGAAGSSVRRRQGPHIIRLGSPRGPGAAGGHRLRVAPLRVFAIACNCCGWNNPARSGSER